MPYTMNSNTSHIPRQPSWFIAFRIIQLILTVIVLALSAYGLATSDLIWSALCLAIFTASVGVPVLIWELVAMSGSPRAYNYWAVLAFDIFLVIFWLISFALVAALTGAIADATTYEYTTKRLMAKRDYYYYSDIFVTYTYFIILAVNAAVGAVNWVMYVVTVVLQSIYIHRHRQAGGHNRPVGLDTFGDSAAPDYHSSVPIAEKRLAQESTASVKPAAQQQSYQQQNYVPSPIQPHVQSDQYPTYVGEHKA